jgi:hypothetical protein
MTADLDARLANFFATNADSVLIGPSSLADIRRRHRRRRVARTSTFGALTVAGLVASLVALRAEFPGGDEADEVPSASGASTSMSTTTGTTNPAPAQVETITEDGIVVSDAILGPAIEVESGGTAARAVVTSELTAPDSVRTAWRNPTVTPSVLPLTVTEVVHAQTGLVALHHSGVPTESKQVFTSTDGLAWPEVTPPDGYRVTSAARNGDGVVLGAVGPDGLPAVATQTGGSGWSIVRLNTDGVVADLARLQRLASDAGVQVAVAVRDGVTLTTVSISGWGEPNAPGIIGRKLKPGEQLSTTDDGFDLVEAFPCLRADNSADPRCPTVPARSEELEQEVASYLRVPGTDLMVAREGVATVQQGRFDQLDPSLRQGARPSSRLFVESDGSMSEVVLPDSSGDVVLFVDALPSRFVLSASPQYWSGDSPEPAVRWWESSDGRTWQPLGSDIGSVDPWYPPIETRDRLMNLSSVDIGPSGATVPVLLVESAGGSRRAVRLDQIGPGTMDFWSLVASEDGAAMLAVSSDLTTYLVTTTDGVNLKVQEVATLDRRALGGANNLRVVGSYAFVDIDWRNDDGSISWQTFGYSI